MPNVTFVTAEVLELHEPAGSSTSTGLPCVMYEGILVGFQPPLAQLTVHVDNIFLAYDFTTASCVS